MHLKPSKRYQVLVEDRRLSTSDKNEALAALAGWMPLSASMSDIEHELDATGAARTAAGNRLGQIVDLHWQPDDLTDDERIRHHVRTLHSGDDRVEVPDLPVQTTDDGVLVDVWFWVSELDADIPEYCDGADQLAECYGRAASHPAIEFETSPEVSFGHRGAAVLGVVRVRHSEITACRSDRP